MNKRTGVYFIAVILLAAGAVTALLAQQPEETGAPQFTTIPIHNRMREVTLQNGHAIYVPPIAREHINEAGKPGNGGGGGGNHGGGGKGGSAPPPDFGNPGAVSVSGQCFANGSNNYDATCARDSYQGEPMLAASGSKLIGAENDIYPGACSATAADGSFGDCGLSATISVAGTSWQRFKLSRNWGGHDFLLGFDPSTAVNSAGHYFVAYGVSDSSGANGIVVVRSTDGGGSWTKTNPVVLNLGGNTFEDKFWMAADPNNNKLYVAWDRNKGNNQMLMVSSSADEGQTWSAPVKINDGTSKFERVIYAFPAVDPNDGTVYVLWYDYAARKIFIDKSSNGGSSWGTDVAVASTNIGFSVDLGCNGGRGMTPAPQMAIDSNGNIFIVYANQLPGANHDFDVFITASSNGGAGWSSPKLVSSTDAGHQYNPAIAINASGVINVSYQDRRDDANNCRTHTYLSRFTGSNLSRVPGGDIRVSDADSNFNGNPNGPGDYQGIACLGSTCYPYFSDHRDANATVDGNSSTLDGGFEIYSSIQ
jgi:hypothetical protein